MRAFGADERKMVAVFRDGGRENIVIGDVDNFRKKELLEEFKNMEKQRSFSMYASKHEHSGFNVDVVYFGWMLESLLQHRGIEYHVDNKMIGKKYRYNPSKQEIIFE